MYFNHLSTSINLSYKIIITLLRYPVNTKKQTVSKFRHF